MYVTARTTYAMRALVAMAHARPATISAPALAEAEKMPFTFLQTILGELRRARLVVSQRGNDGGYRLARPAIQITVGEVVRAMDTAFAPFGEERERPAPPEAAAHLEELWHAADTALRWVLDETTLEDLTHGRLPAHVRALADLARETGGPAGHITINVN
ncbi:Rrf2 family transcriptional regulator [Actinomadura madurae]|uniref:Rrf2 family protein n=1 Tax=Actinomadura madurae TaxID=1993 RepID=A0A1I5QTR1_9ACTN|nr:Rrf2 family transcriptional regulator [Actinomadura madurae]SFP49635.1 Rrf2 family protein [Actinomadura madurae]SPT58770.1 Cysteine metabolism repressor [Actinomadura madurae]